MIPKHSFLNDIPQAVEFQIGELAASLLDGKLYYKNLNSDVLRLGNSFRYLVDFNEFKPSSLNNNYFLRYQDESTLTTSLPFIYLNDIDGVATTDGALTANLDNTIGSAPVVEFNLTGLSDTDFTLSEATANYVVCFNYSPGFESSDYFADTWYGKWSLQPEASKILSFDDVGIEGTLASGFVFRTVLDIERSSKKLYATRFQIAYDKAPELSADLNVATYNIYNQNYYTQYVSVTKAASTVLLDCDTYDEFVIDCNNSVNVLNLIGSFTSSYDSQHLKHLSITVKNFNGIIQLPDYVYFENGIAPIIQPGDNVFIGMLYYTNSAPKLLLMHKAIGLQKVN